MLSVLLRLMFSATEIQACFGCEDIIYEKGVLDLMKVSPFDYVDKDTKKIIIFIEKDTDDYIFKFHGKSSVLFNITTLSKKDNLFTFNIDTSGIGNAISTLIIDGVKVVAASQQTFELNNLIITQGSKFIANINKVEYVNIPEELMADFDSAALVGITVQL